MHNGRNYKYEDTVQCYFYSTKQLSSDDWDKQCISINHLISSLAKDYIWHRDEFKVNLPVFSGAEKDAPYYLISTTCFGDNIEDEWFIVYLVLEITKHFQDIVVQIQDNDGEFLLIEAANYLPTWANPDTSDNRVFLYKGQIHIIDPCLHPLESNNMIDEAISIIYQNPKETEAAWKIQEAILHRIGDYPQKIEDLSHMAVLRLPVDIATILTMKPSLIAPIVTTYCNIDVVDLRRCKNLEYKDLVTTEIKFTKCLYAMLVHSKDVKVNVLKDNHDTISKLGMKLSFAYEIITKSSSTNVFLSPDYKKFINSLTTNGYFKDNLEGSKNYKELIKKANEYFLNMECPISSYVSNVISQLKETPEFNDLKKNLLELGDTDLPMDQNDGWLNINSDELNIFLNKNYGNLKNDIDTPEAVTARLSNFLKHKSDFEGIEKRDDNIDNDNEIDFDCDQFVNSIEKMLNIISSNVDADDISDTSDEIDEDFDKNVSEVTKYMDQELNTKLQKNPECDTDANTAILNNLVQSIKEEGVSGPSSNILRSVGIHKSVLLDSDDDLI